MFARAARLSPAARNIYQTIRVPVVGPAGKGEISQLGPQRTVNWYPVKPEREGDDWFLRGRPGLSLLGTLPRTPIRGWHVHKDRLFAVAGARIYEVYADGTYYEWGKISTTRKRVVMASMLDTIVIGDGTGFSALDISAGTVTKITDAPRGTFCVFFNQRILYQGEDGKVYYSDLNDPTVITGLSFFTAESLPDEITAMVTTEDQIWLFGRDSVEVWYDSGDVDNPFQRIPSGVLWEGCEKPFTVLRLDNSIWWVQRDKEGNGIVRRSEGIRGVRVSTSAVERFTKASDDLTAYSYQEDGHSFYVLNSEAGTWAFDIKTGEWHERAWLNPATGPERHRVGFHAYCYGLHMCGDHESGKVYSQGLDRHSDAGQEIRRTRITQRVVFGGNAASVRELLLDFASGVGIDGSGQGSDPKVMLRASNDGVTFGPEYTASIGAIGQYDTQVRFTELGLGRDWCFEISVSDPVLVGLMGGRAKVMVGAR